MNIDPTHTTQSVRALARALGVSPTTVSEALRGVPRVAHATAVRVRAAAQRYGYRRNPIAGAVLSEIRKTRTALYRGTMAMVEVVEPELPANARAFFERLYEGAVARSGELGFSLDRFRVGADHLEPARLNSILEARNIGGLLVLPSYREIHLEEIAWDRLAGVYLDRVIEFPPMHSVCTDHHGAVWAALSRVEHVGHGRVGLVVQAQQDERLQNRWEGAYYSYHQRPTGLTLLPILVAREITEREFGEWFRGCQPEVVIAHDTRCIAWMERLGAKIPDSHGFVGLNAAMCERACAAIDQQPALIGARGAELLIGQILRGESGLPENPCNLSVPARMLGGATLRAAGPSG